MPGMSRAVEAEGRAAARLARGDPRRGQLRAGRRAGGREVQPAHRSDQLRRRRPDAAEVEAPRPGDRRDDAVGRDGGPLGRGRSSRRRHLTAGSARFRGHAPPAVAVLVVPAAPPDRAARLVSMLAGWARNPIDRFILAGLSRAGPCARARGRPAHLDPPTQLRPHRVAAHARGGRGVPRRSARPMPTSGWSIDSWPALITASAGPATGSTWSATPRPPATNSTTTSRTPTATATTSSAPSTPTSPMTASWSNTSPATCSNRPGGIRSSDSTSRSSPPASLYLGEGTHSPVDVREEEVRRIDNQIDVMSKAFLGPDGRVCPLPRPQVRPDRQPRLLRAGRLPPQLAVPASLHRSARSDRRAGPAACRGPRRDPGRCRVAGRWQPVGEATASEGTGAAPHAADEGVFEDFDRDDYGDWHVTGDAFGRRPTRRGRRPDRPRLADRPARSGRRRAVAHSGLVSDRLQGVLRSRTFTIESRYIHYLAAGRGGRSTSSSTASRRSATRSTAA